MGCQKWTVFGQGKGYLDEKWTFASNVRTYAMEDVKPTETISVDRNT